MPYKLRTAGNNFTGVNPVLYPLIELYEGFPKNRLDLMKLVLSRRFQVCPILRFGDENPELLFSKRRY